MNQENYEPIAIKTFSEFYKAFLTSNASADTESEFMIIYNNDESRAKRDESETI